MGVPDDSDVSESLSVMRKKKCNIKKKNVTLSHIFQVIQLWLVRAHMAFSIPKSDLIDGLFGLLVFFFSSAANSRIWQNQPSEFRKNYNSCLMVLNGE